MRFSIPKLASRRLLTLAAAALISWILFMVILPSDNPFRAFLRFNYSRFQKHDESWLWKPNKFPVNFHEDVGLLIKTGYGTKERVLAQMRAMGLQRTRNDLLVVGDFASRVEGDGVSVDVHDVVERLLKDHAVANYLEEPRALKYRELQKAISSQNADKALEIGKENGWDLDALKFMPGLELAYRRAPEKKWWVVMDDDTYLIKPSLEKVLARLNPEKDHYIGNAIGDYRSRFAHGGSAVLLSQRTVHHLFEHPNVVAEAKRMSLTITYGDKLVGSALMELGVYLDERFTPYFNGERPVMTKVTAQKFCLPLVSFHGISEGGKMLDVGHRFEDKNRPFFWGELWAFYDQPDIQGFEGHPVRWDHDHVGRLDGDTKTFEKVPSAEACAKVCDKDSKSCLAWTWVQESWECHLAPWVVIGEEEKGKASGIHWPRAKVVGQKCEDVMREAGCLTEGGECFL